MWENISHAPINPTCTPLIIMANIGILIIIAYFVICLVIGYLTHKKESTSEYLIGSHKIGFFRTTASIFAVAGGAILISGTAMGFELGYAALWFWLGIALGLILLAFASKHVRKDSEKKNFHLITDYLFEKYGKNCAILSSILLFIGFFALLTAQFIAGASLFSPLINISYGWVVAIIALGTLLYILLGGYKAVVNTDLLQAIIMIILIIIIVAILSCNQVLITSLPQFNTIGLGEIIIYILMGLFSMFAGADIWQRIISAKSNKVARNSTIIAAGLFFVFGFILTIIGILVKTSFSTITSNEAFAYGMFKILPQSILIVAILMILAAITSTIDTELFMLSTSIAKDFRGRSRQLSDEETKKIVKYSLVILIALASIFAIFFTNIITIIFALVSVSLIVSPTIIGSLFFNLKNKAVFISLLFGLISLVLLFVFGMFSQDTAILPLPISLITLIIGQIVIKRQK